MRVHGAMGLGRGVAGLGALLTLTGLLGCRAPGPAPTLEHDGEAQAAVPAALGEVRSASVPLRVRVLEARKVSAGAIQVALEIAHTDPSTVPPASVEAAAQALAGLSVVTADRRRRLFPLQALGAGEGGWAPAVPPPGGTTTFRVLFASDPQSTGPLTLLLPGFPPVPGIPVS